MRIGCSPPSSQPNPAAWVWDFRSAVRLWKPTVADCGPQQTYPREPRFSSLCQQTRTQRCDVAPVCELSSTINHRPHSAQHFECHHAQRVNVCSASCSLSPPAFRRSIGCAEGILLRVRRSCSFVRIERCQNPRDATFLPGEVRSPALDRGGQLCHPVPRELK